MFQLYKVIELFTPSVFIIQYIDDLINYQKRFAYQFEISDYVPNFNKLLNIFSNNWKMRIARFVSYNHQVRRLPLYEITQIGDVS